MHVSMLLHCLLDNEQKPFTILSAGRYFVCLSMLLHVLIDNEQHDQQSLQTNYWQKNVLKDIILQYYNNTTTYYRTNSLCVAYPSIVQYFVM
jgi:hypothetical protein